MKTLQNQILSDLENKVEEIKNKIDIHRKQADDNE